MSVGSATDKLLHGVASIDRDDVLLALELRLAFYFAR
jgi:hypothetical protein